MFALAMMSGLLQLEENPGFKIRPSELLWAPKGPGRLSTDAGRCKESQKSVLDSS